MIFICIGAQFKMKLCAAKFIHVFDKIFFVFRIQMDSKHYRNSTSKDGKNRQFDGEN